MQIDTRKLKKLIIKTIPYVAFSHVGNLIGFAYRTAEGNGFQEKLLPFMSNLGVAFARIFPSLHPFDLLIGLGLAGVMRLVLYVKSKNRKKFRQGEEYGSAVWGGEKDIEPYVDLSCPENNVILTKTESLTMGKPSAPKFARNKNILVIGGSGSGKTRFFVKPNLMQMHSSYVVTDPKGTVLVECGKMLERGRPKRVDGKIVYQKTPDGKYKKDDKGKYIPVYEPYKIKVFNTIDFAKSMHYNPFAYISKKNREKDILKFVEVLIKNTSSQQPSGDDFWVKAEKLLYTAYIALIFAMYPEDEWNFETLIDMINNSECREDDEEFKNSIDLEFEIVECWLNHTKHDDPDVMADYGDVFEAEPDAEQRRMGAFALKQYKAYKLAAGVVCSKRLLNQAVGKSLRTHNLKPKKGAQVMRKNEKITALYERLSRDDFGKDDDQQRESNSISNQKAMLEEFAARQGFTNIVHFTDDGISGTCFDRPGFLAMMKEVEAGNVEYLCIKDMSRMGRDYLKVGQIMEILRQRGVRLIAINDGVDSARGDDDFTPFRNIMKNISHSGKVSNDFSLFRRFCCINRCFRCSCGKFSIVHGV